MHMAIEIVRYINIHDHGLGDSLSTQTWTYIHPYILWTHCWIHRQKHSKNIHIFITLHAYIDTYVHTYFAEYIFRDQLDAWWCARGREQVYLGTHPLSRSGSWSRSQSWSHKECDCDHEGHTSVIMTVTTVFVTTWPRLWSWPWLVFLLRMIFWFSNWKFCQVEDSFSV
jgi:hypothetical protein